MWRYVDSAEVSSFLSSLRIGKILAHGREIMVAIRDLGASRVSCSRERRRVLKRLVSDSIVLLRSPMWLNSGLLWGFFLGLFLTSRACRTRLKNCTAFGVR